MTGDFGPIPQSPRSESSSQQAVPHPADFGNRLDLCESFVLEKYAEIKTGLQSFETELREHSRITSESILFNLRLRLADLAEGGARTAAYSSIYRSLQAELENGSDSSVSNQIRELGLHLQRLRVPGELAQTIEERCFGYLDRTEKKLDPSVLEGMIPKLFRARSYNLLGSVTVLKCLSRGYLPFPIQ